MAVKLRTVDCAGLKPNVGRKKSKKLKSRERSSGGQNQNSFWNPFIGVTEGYKMPCSYFFVTFTVGVWPA